MNGMLAHGIARIRADQTALLARLEVGARVSFRAWDGATITGTASRLVCGDWCVKDASGALWLLDPRALITGKEG